MTATSSNDDGTKPGHFRRVALISHSNALYGAGRSLLELVRSLRSMGAEVGVVLPDGGLLEDELRRYQCRIWNMPLPAWVQPIAATTTPPPNWGEFTTSASHIEKKLGAWGADLLWTNSSISPVGALAAESLGIPHVWHLRELNGKGYGYKFTVGETVAADLIRSAACRIAVSRTVKTFYENLGCGHCNWIYNGIALGTRLAARMATDRSGGMARLVIAGQVTEMKGQSTAIEAISKLRTAGYPVMLRVVGGGEIEHCRKLANGLGTNGWVEFSGFSRSVDEHYRWADIALSCAKAEAMGRSTAEAMSWGLPVAGHCGAGTGELVGDAQAGLLYDGGADQLAQVIAALIDDRATARKMSEGGQRWARAHVSSEHHASQIMQVVDAMASTTGAASTRNTPIREAGNSSTPFPASQSY